MDESKIADRLYDSFNFVAGADGIEAEDFSNERASLLSKVIRYDKSLSRCLNCARLVNDIQNPSNREKVLIDTFRYMIVRAISFAKLLPYSRYNKDQKIIHWDSFSLSTLARSLIEARISFHHLGTDMCTESEWECRIDVQKLHYVSTQNKISNMEFNTTGEDYVAGEIEKLKLKIQNHSSYLSATKEIRNKIDRENSAYLYSIDSLAEMCGMAIPKFKLLYKDLSQDTHSLPCMSHFRDKNYGKESSSEHKNIETAVEAATLALDLSDMEMLSFIVSTAGDYRAPCNETPYIR